ncbi:MAG TPA: pyruvate kinase [Syntrophomonadaceae bacterium]|nr:pyruvate kinase [Syntrophomonadaceae bacterium]HPR92666.1 pyruvate kinase [Syntrophomonadaceae bacterium]
MRKTKIICTIGPASEKPEVLDKMIEAGMNVARLNFSHGTYEEHLMRIKNLRQAAARKGRPLALMLDTKGPEIRTGLLKDGKVLLQTGQRFILTTRTVPGDDKEVFINYPDLPREVKKGITILLADGLLSLMVEDTTDTDIICSVINSGELGEKKGINVPGVRTNMPFLSQKDIDDINFGIDNKVDFIAASFATTAEDILDIRRLLENRHADIEIIAKIESQAGVDNLDDMIKIADGIMVARGDLGVEIPAEDVPLVQKIIVDKCHPTGKMVIIATQMLDSMIVNPRPTRAEVSDVANAIFDGADAIMLSGETAAGKYPVEVVQTMARIAKRAEEALPYEEILRKKRTRGNLSVTDAISYATCATAMSLEAAAIISATRSGYTAKMVAKYRPLSTIIAATPDARIYNKLSLVWGVYPVIIPDTPGTDELFDVSVQSAVGSGYIKNGDLVVLTAGVPTGFSGATNLLKVHVVGKILVRGMGIGLEPVSGRVRIIKDVDDLEKIMPGEIIVTRGADRSLAPYLQKITAIIAEEGGLTSDAAIMGLNANIPVIVGAKEATSLMADDMEITLDTQRGIVYEGKAMVR